jgi:regulator of protease activity HflC (stomatin/prohibitin superfamily)
VLALIISLFSIYAEVGALVLWLVFSAVAAREVWRLMRARQLVLVQKDVPLLWGLVRLIAWDPVEGVLILRNKSIAFSDDDLQDAQGGVRLLYPLLGEELALRVPLEVQTLRFEDENVLTREYLSVTIRGTMKWRIVDIRKFYLLVSRELRSTTDHNDRVSLSPSTRPLSSGDAADGSTIDRLLSAVIQWMRILAEEQTRFVVSRARSGLLIADRLSQQFINPASVGAAGMTPGGANEEWGSTADGLAGAIHDTIAHRLDGYGIAVEDVSLQEIKLPQGIIDECVAAAQSYYLPLRGQREAMQKVAELRAQAEVLGPDAIAAREVVQGAPPFAIADFLTAFLQKRLSGGGGEAGSSASNAGAPGADAGTAAAIAAIAGTQAALATQQPRLDGER